ncbi:uncharacterized protein LOC110447739 [Mizuhopecten yessoensis]|uniref:Uncharacterized protein n=1 Tax=Mizuhopecten yessoensis TaxID=6573 RepID=A0A210QUR1_MIZYE|nr:uncharacterized protein LOC110447739 [Mizuhopecten yessoensis]XP_021349308.1 uncharacterized protein LOC110447739 [Mizuhopecten yessoensis]OWF52513.1 hypothetical protein KP79_PYT06830 [Mizuhopecten yessoensis]
MAVFENMCALLLFSMESYHVTSHIMVITRTRLLPRKDLVRLRFYFLVDLLTVFCSSVLFLQRLQWLAGIQILQHLYYFVFWEKTKPAKKIISWSSIDWTKSEFQQEWHFDSILGTLFDIVVHLALAVLLGGYLTTVQIIVSLLVAHGVLFTFIWSQKFAWSNPWSPPQWVQKRVQPVTLDKARWF